MGDQNTYHAVHSWGSSRKPIVTPLGDERVALHTPVAAGQGYSIVFTPEDLPALRALVDALAYAEQETVKAWPIDPTGSRAVAYIQLLPVGTATVERIEFNPATDGAATNSNEIVFTIERTQRLTGAVLLDAYHQTIQDLAMDITPSAVVMGTDLVFPPGRLSVHCGQGHAIEKTP